MAFLSELWLPVVLSAAFVFIVSSVIHMALPIHKGDCAPLPNEAKVLEAMRVHGVGPGAYVFPCPGSMKEMSTPEMQAKYVQGPVGNMVVLPKGSPRIGKALLQWFLFSLVISVFVAYVASFSLSRGANYLVVFRLTGTVATLAYGVSHITDSIWKGLPWRISLKFVFDGLVYGLVTAGAFGWCWPKAI